MMAWISADRRWPGSPATTAIPSLNCENCRRVVPYPREYDREAETITLDVSVALAA